jgi:hypothetical protein
MTKLSRITNVCTKFNIDFDSVELEAGYKSVYFRLPDIVIESLRDDNGNLIEKYEAFCDTYGIWYDSDYDAWAMYL